MNHFISKTLKLLHYKVKALHTIFMLVDFMLARFGQNFVERRCNPRGKGLLFTSVHCSGERFPIEQQPCRMCVQRSYGPQFESCLRLFCIRTGTESSGVLEYALAPVQKYDSCKM